MVRLLNRDGGTTSNLKYSNLFGDTTFVPASDVRAAIDRCGADKIVFGSDAPILRERYGVTTAEIHSMLSPSEARQVFRENAVRLFQLGVSHPKH